MPKLRNKLIYRRNSFYHIYNRGNHKENIFRREKDYKVFCSLLHRYCKKYGLTIISYCFLPNHYHLLLKNGVDTESISKCMQGFMISYVAYSNREYKKVGRLFQGPFQVRRIVGIRDLESIISYLRNNPLEADLIGGAPVESYRWFYLRSTSQKRRRKPIMEIDEQMMNEGEV